MTERFKAKESKRGHVGHLRGHARLGNKYTQCGKVIGLRFYATEAYKPCGACLNSAVQNKPPAAPAPKLSAQVVISVRGGVATCTSKPEGVEVVINDYD